MWAVAAIGVCSLRLHTAAGGGPRGWAELWLRRGWAPPNHPATTDNEGTFDVGGGGHRPRTVELCYSLGAGWRYAPVAALTRTIPNAPPLYRVKPGGVTAYRVDVVGSTYRM